MGEVGRGEGNSENILAETVCAGGAGRVGAEADLAALLCRMGDI